MHQRGHNLMQNWRGRAIAKTSYEASSSSSESCCWDFIINYHFERRAMQKSLKNTSSFGHLKVFLFLAVLNSRDGKSKGPFLHMESQRIRDPNNRKLRGPIMILKCTTTQDWHFGRAAEMNRFWAGATNQFLQILVIMRWTLTPKFSATELQFARFAVRKNVE